MSYKIQSVIFNKHYYTFNEAKTFIKKNGYKIGRIDITKNYYRFRQLEPNYLLRSNYSKIRTKKLKYGIKLILYYK